MDNSNWMAIKTGILNSLPEWAEPVPFPIKSIAIKDAWGVIKAAKQGFKKDGQIRKCMFRSRKILSSLFMCQSLP